MIKGDLIVFLIVFTIYSCSQSNSGNSRSKVTDTNKVVVQKSKPIVDVYLENSGSMNGYVKGVTEFEQGVYNYLSDIRISKMVDSLNLYYINSEVIPQGTVQNDNDVLRDFIEKLEPNDFKINGGNLSTSDISEVIKSVLDRSSSNTVSILVTDGIFSPGKGKDAEQYLVNQQIGIKNSFSNYLNSQVDCGVIVYQLSSKFDGLFYNKFDQKQNIKSTRPFYIYLIGKTQFLSNLRKAVPENTFKGSGILNMYSIAKTDNDIKYILNPSVGVYEKSKVNTNTTITKLKKEKHTNKVKFAVDVDFSSILMNEEYLLKKNNYDNNSNYVIEIKPKTNPSGCYTHTINFSSEKITKGEVIVKLKASYPDWVDGANDDEGIVAVEGKTYGIKYQIMGIYEAFTFENKYLAEIKILIK